MLFRRQQWRFSSSEAGAYARNSHCSLPALWESSTRHWYSFVAHPAPPPICNSRAGGQVVSCGLWRLVPSIRMESSDATSLAANSAHTWGKARFASTGGTRHRSYLWPIYALLEWLVDTTLRLSKNVSAQTTTQHLLRLTGM